MKTYNISNRHLADSLSKLESESQLLGDEIQEIRVSQKSTNDDISNLELRVKKLFEECGLEYSNKEVHDSTLTETPCHASSEGTVLNDDKHLDSLSPIDIIMSCIAGGLGVLVDFLIVRIPKNTTIIRKKERIFQQGSPLTEWIRSIGFDQDGKTSHWIKVLEKYFKVNYDISKIPGEKGFCPKSHRIYNLGHDPSPFGFICALKDLITGSMSYIDKNGVLKIVKTQQPSLFKIFAAPIIWIGHILSDVFTKAGIPIPGACLLRSLRFGSFGEKGRTIAQVVEYMFLEGYDLRHLATMSTVNAVIEVVIRIFHYLTKPTISQFARPAALAEVDKEMLRVRLEKMRLIGYSVATAGNIAKLAVNEWNPLALNLPVWIEFIRAAIKEIERRNSIEFAILDIVKQRQELDYNFAILEERVKHLNLYPDKDNHSM